MDSACAERGGGVSILIMSEVWKHAPADKGDLLILLALADHADDDGRCFPSISRLAEKGRMSERNVKRCLRALEECGVVKTETGAGPKGCNVYIVDVDAMRDMPKTTACGDDKMSPHEDEAGGDKTGTQGVTKTTGGGDAHVTQTIIEPSGTLQAREARAREAAGADDVGGDIKSIHRAFKRWFPTWPAYLDSSEPEALKAWEALSPEEREAAADRAADYVAALRKTGRSYVCKAAVYLSEKRWMRLTEKTAETAQPALHKPFSRGWMAKRLVALLGPISEHIPQPTTFIQNLIDRGGPEGERERLKHLSRHGWPMVNTMDARSVGSTVTPDIVALSAGFEKVHVASERFADWRALHEARGWPWLPPAGNHEWFYFPAGGPDCFHEFEAKVGELKGGEAA